jgi:hypothetical protein
LELLGGVKLIHNPLMKSKPVKTMDLNKVKATAAAAGMKRLMIALFPHLGIRDDILDRAKAMVPEKLAGPYRAFWEEHVITIVQTDTMFIQMFAICQQLEEDIRKGLKGKAAAERMKVEHFITEFGPVKLLSELWPDLLLLRYEYFTESALKMLRKASLLKQVGNVFEDSTTLNIAFTMAMTKDDLDFFVRVGDVLRDHQDDVGSLIPERNFDPLQIFLLKHWTDKVGNIPALATLNLKDLTEVCVKQLRRPQLTPDSVDKTRQRLGLRFPRSKSL